MQAICNTKLSKPNAQVASRTLKKNFRGYVNHLLGETLRLLKPLFWLTYVQGIFSKPSNDIFEAPEWLPTSTCADLPMPLAHSQWIKLLQGSRDTDSHPGSAHTIRCHTNFSQIVHCCDESALSDPSSPKNFRLIDLTSCIGTILTSMVNCRCCNYLLTNGFLNTSVQKAFQLKTSRCEEH